MLCSRTSRAAARAIRVLSLATSICPTNRFCCSKKLADRAPTSQKTATSPTRSTWEETSAGQALPANPPHTIEANAVEEAAPRAPNHIAERRMGKR